jgi:hypothetical protein
MPLDIMDFFYNKFFLQYNEKFLWFYFYVIFYQFLPIKDNLTLAILLNMVIIYNMDFFILYLLLLSFILSFNINNMLKETPRKRKSLTAAQQKEICLKKETTPYLKQKNLNYIDVLNILRGHVTSNITSTFYI